MFKKYFLLISFFLLSYLSLSNLRDFGKDKFLKKILLDLNIDKNNTLFIINEKMWPSSYYFYKTFGKSTKLCLNSESREIKNKEISGKIYIPYIKNQTNIYCKNSFYIDYEDYNFILYLYPSGKKNEGEFMDYKLIKNYQFNVRYGIMHHLIKGNLNYFKKITK